MMTTRKPSPDRMQAAPPKRLKLSSGSSRVLRLEGPVGHECLVEAVYPDGTSVAYEGSKGHERMVAASWPNGDKAHYSGEGDAERLTHVQCINKKRGGQVFTMDDEERLSELARTPQLKA